MHAPELGVALLRLARGAIEQSYGLANVCTPSPAHEALALPGATFVTITQRGDLRGCIGSLEAYRALSIDVRENAVAAAFRDTRFAPIARAELTRVSVEVSLLTAAQPMAFKSEDDLLAQLRPGVDGVILRYASYRSTFLPQVWKSFPDAREFLAHLKQKAGLPADFWASGIGISRYEVSKWKEAEFQQA
jgi:hypothetical protein